MAGIISRSRHALSLSPQAMALILVLVSILGGLASWINQNHGGYRADYNNKPFGVSVAYSSQDSQDPEFIVVIKDRSGRPLKTIYSVYMWMPDGKIESLGVYGGSGIIKINYSVVREFSRKWHDYIVSMKSDPRMVLPGLILMGAVHENSAVYDSLRGVPINTREILGNRSVVIEIIEDLSVKKPLVRINGTNQSTGSLAMGTGMGLQSDWPPGEIPYRSDCIYFYPYKYCFYWGLESSDSVIGESIPLVATYVYGPEASRVYDVKLRAYYRSTSSVTIDFMITAEVGDGASIEHQIIGASMSLSGDNVWLNADRGFINGVSFTLPATLGIGVKGDMAVGKYRLYVYVYVYRDGSWVLIYKDPYNTVANMTLMRPQTMYNRMIDLPMVGGPPSKYSSNTLEAAFAYYIEKWSMSNRKWNNYYVRIDAFDVMDQTGTLPTLSISAAVAGILCALKGPLSLACAVATVSALTLGASVGATVKSSTYMYLDAIITLKLEYVNSIYVIGAGYLYSPGTLLYNNNRYYIGSLYVDALVSYTGYGL